MREVSVWRLGVLSLLLTATAFLVYGFDGNESGTEDNRPNLQRAFAAISGWPDGEILLLNRELTDELDLDDYLFRTCRRGGDSVTLYIGYYHTARKVGAAHDPLVCFQGQGWKITHRERGDYALNGRPDLKISYTSMVAEREADKELIVYWFQTNGLAVATTLRQKLAMIHARLIDDRERNAFVRISAPLDGRSPEAARRRIFEFVDDFYPGFHSLLAGG